MPLQFNEIQPIELPAVTALASATADTQFVPLAGYRTKGNFSIQATVTGDGTATIKYMVKYKLTDTGYVPVNSSTVATGLIKTSGSEGDGVDSFPVTPNMVPYLAFQILETGGANPVAVAITLAIQ